MNTRLLSFLPQAGGIWDAAFAEFGNRPAGFDLSGSPFGEDPFGFFPFLPMVTARLKYKDVFTGFAFAHRLEEQYRESGIPDYYEGFEEEAMRRAGLRGDDYLEFVRADIDRSKRSLTGARTDLAGRAIESLVEIAVLALFGIGGLIGIVACVALRVRTRGSTPTRASV